MLDFTTFLLTMLYDGSLVRAAMKVQHTLVTPSILLHYKEPDSKKCLASLLPPHLAVGPIVDVEPILDAFFVIDEATKEEYLKDD